MKKLMEILQHHKEFEVEVPLDVKDLILLQKNFAKNNYPMLPLSFLHFLQHANGVSSGESVILGINASSDELPDIVAYNQMFNETSDQVIIGYDDFDFLVYNHTAQKYQLIDREDNVVVEEYAENDLEKALTSVLHIGYD